MHSLSRTASVSRAKHEPSEHSAALVGSAVARRRCAGARARLLYRLDNCSALSHRRERIRWCRLPRLGSAQQAERAQQARAAYPNCEHAPSRLGLFRAGASVRTLGGWDLVRPRGLLRVSPVCARRSRMRGATAADADPHAHPVLPPALPEVTARPSATCSCLDSRCGRFVRPARLAALRQTELRHCRRPTTR